MKKYISLLLVSFILAACSGANKETTYPIDPKQIREQRAGKITGEDGWTIFGGKKKDDSSSSANGIGVNSYLWRATLDTISFMPLVSADPFGGVIVTDWYEDPTKRKERFKLTILIFDRKLRSDAVKVSVFRQIQDSKNQWHDEKASERVARDLEAKILSRARELRSADHSK